ncbi:MAG: DUF4265 domain-containing protein [Verrucomicrobiota bacterium]|jgi:hypothetical protein
MSKIKINFELHRDEDGYPPIESESLWAQESESGLYLLDNIPFFEREATVGDLVAANAIDGVLWFVRVVKPSANSLIRAVFFDTASIDEVRQKLSSIGCESEYFQKHNLIAINVPPEASLKAVQDYLAAVAARGWIDYEEPILRQH